MVWSLFGAAGWPRRLTVAGLLVAAVPGADAGPVSVDLPAGWEGHARAALANGECFTATSLVEQAIAAGDPVGFVVRAEMYETGRCVPRRPSQAVRDYGEAARRDYEVGYARLGYLVLNGIGIPADGAWAELLFKQTALGLVSMAPERRRRFVRLLMAEWPVPAELDDALSWLEEIETSGSRGLFQAALRLRHGGDGWPRNEAVARRWLRDAALAGLTEARFELAQWLLARPSSPQDVQRGLSDLHRSALEGYPPALREYGRRLAEGRDVAPNDFDAYVVLLRAQEAGADVEALLAEVVKRLSRAELSGAREMSRLPGYVPYFTRGQS
jgi:TPR repeat protein